MSEIDKNLYADAEEIATAIGKSPQTVRRMADKDNGNWAYTPEKIRGTEKKWFLIAKLPTSPTNIRNAVRHQRNCKRFLINEQRDTENLPNASTGWIQGLERATDRGNARYGNPIDGISNELYGKSNDRSSIEHAALGGSKNPSVDGSDRSAAAFTTGSHGQHADEGAFANQRLGKNGVDETSQSAKKRVLAVNGERSVSSDLACVTHGGLQPDIKTPVKTTEKQRLTDGARQYIINFLDTFAGSDANAVIFLNQGYIAGTLGFDLQDAYEQCNAKKGGKIKPLCLRTIQHWKKRKNDVNSCIPKKTREKVDWQTVGWLHLFFVFYRKPQKPSVMEAHRQFKNYWNAKAIGDDCPSHWAVRRLLEVVPELIKEWGRSTGSEYRAYQSFVRRDWSNMSSNEVWVGDGHSFKAKVQSPEDAGQALAPEVTLIIDAASRFIVGWAFSLSENQIAVSESLGNGMLKYGKPLVYYSDNGSGQTAKTIDHPAGGMLARLGVRHETGIPGNPQGRGIIEGIWDITMIAVARDMPTFQGTGMDGGAARKNTIDINAAKKRGELAENVPSWDEFKGKVEARIHWYNTEHQHSALDGKTPADVYFANFDDSWAVHLTDEEKTTLYRPYKERTPTRGEINLHRNIYFSKKLEELPAKAKVRATYDLRDPSKIWVSDLDGVFICEAVWDGNKVAGFPESLMDQLKENRKEGKKKRAMEKYNEAEMEGRSVIEGEVLKRIEFNAGETIEPLKIVQPDFIKQKPEEEKRLSYLDTMKALYGDQKAAGNE